MLKALNFVFYVVEVLVLKIWMLLTFSILIYVSG